ncbi:hypothetical protein [Nitrospira sp. Ecomares 2.1]
MARPLQLQFTHALYYVTSRGDGRQAIVKTVADRQAFLDGLAQVVERFGGGRCHAYCLMNNPLLQQKHTPKPIVPMDIRCGKLRATWASIIPLCALDTKGGSRVFMITRPASMSENDWAPHMLQPVHL